MAYTRTRQIPAAERIAPIDANAVVIRAVAAWTGVEVTRRAGGVVFRRGGREIGHLHDPPGKLATADLEFPKAVSDDLVATGRARRHVTDRLGVTGWVAAPLRTHGEVAAAVALFRDAYEWVGGGNGARNPGGRPEAAIR